MIEEVLKSIREAEEKAEAIRREGDEKAAAKRLEADQRAEEIAENAKKNAKAKKNAAIVGANATAEKNYARTLSDCKARCEELRLGKDGKAEELSVEIYRRIINGGC